MKESYKPLLMVLLTDKNKILNN